MKSKIRLRFAQYCLLLLLMLVLYRSAQVQLFPSERLKQGRQTLYKTEIYQVASRGNIFDRSQRPLALTINSYSIFAHPHKVKRKHKTAGILSKILNMPVGEIHKTLGSDKPFVWIQRKVDTKIKDQLEAFNLPGIHFLRESKRVYPNDTLAAHALGFADVDMKGIAGVELKFDSALEGIPTKVNVLRDAMGRIIYVGESASSKSRPGYNLILTLDSAVQFAVEKELHQMVKNFDAAGAMAIAMDPRNGEILAIASYPTYDPNRPSKFSSTALRNRLTSEVFEPGSILKPVTIAAALSENTTSFQKIYNCEKGKLWIGHHLITEASTVHARSILPLTDILKYSNNICTVKVALELGAQRLNNYLSLMGFGKLTGIDLPGELQGIVRPVSEWGKIHLATISYGHGIAVTPIQIIRMYSVFANGGYLVSPHVLSRVEDGDQKLIYANDALPGVRVLDQEVAQKMKTLLLKVTDQGGTGILAKPFGFRIPGKTGTAIKYDEKIGGYREGAYISSFVGMFPPENPKVVLMVIVDEPQKKMYGGEVAAPAFRDMSEKIISLLSLHPHVGQETWASSAQKVKVVELKTPISVQAAPASQESMPGLMPELTGLTLSQVREVLAPHRLDFEYTGVGKVVSQLPKPGYELPDGKLVKVVLKR